MKLTPDPVELILYNAMKTQKKMWNLAIKLINWGSRHDSEMIDAVPVIPVGAIYKTTALHIECLY
jgi:hypothetical protein